VAGIIYIVRAVGKKCGGGKTIVLIRLHIIVEGQTEETFVKQVLAPELAKYRLIADAHSITTGRHHGRIYRGGFVKYEHLAGDLTKWMKQDSKQDAWFTTMVDLYRLPVDFPGTAAKSRGSGAVKAVHFQRCMYEDIRQRMTGAPVCERLIPFIQVHEFEALLFSDPEAFASEFPEREKQIAALSAIRNAFATPEEIHDGPDTAPSKRILELLPDYKKPVSGILIAEKIGIGAIRRACPHFNEWIERLTALSNPPI
jgi:hypothetical protein